MPHNINKFIEFIIDLVSEDDIFYNTEIDAHYYFLHGGSYELYKVVHHYFKDSICMMRKDLKHCAIAHQGRLYDANGIIKDPQNFFQAKKEDFEYMERQFGLGIKNLETEHIQKEIEKCRIKDILY